MTDAVEGFDKMQFIRHYQFEKDESKTGRTLETAKVGDVFITKLTIEPRAITGNLYHKETQVILFVSKGKVLFRFVQVNTGQVKDMIIHPEQGIIHVPPYTALASKNLFSGLL